MSAPLSSWYSLHDLQSLAARGAALKGTLALGGLSRLKGLLAEDAGAIEASLELGRESGGWLTARLAMRAAPRLVCQRCLEPFTYEIDEHVLLALLESAALESSLPQGYEPIVVGDDRVQPAQLIEDELIVALPLVPKHARVAECGTLGRGLESDAAPR